jgi:polysaccharide pyruvyl transferase WcaK-like protein
MSRVLLSGYYGQHNAGDDAFVVTCATALHRTPADRIGVLGATLPTVPGLPATALYLRRRWRGMAEVIERHRRRAWGHAGARVVVGGGSVLRDRRGITSLAALLDEAPHATPVALGVSIGPYRDDAAPELLRALLPRFGFIGVRDHASLARAQELAPGSRIELTHDLVPLLPTLRPDLVPAPPDARSGLGIALCRDHVSPSELAALAAMLHSVLTRAPDLHLELLSFNAHPTKGDDDLHRALASAIGMAGRVRQVTYAGNPEVTWRQIARLRGLIAMRLHAAIFAHGGATPTFLIPYEEKGTGWAEMTGHPATQCGALSTLTVDSLAALASGHGALARQSPAEAAAAAARNFAWMEAP